MSCGEGSDRPAVGADVPQDIKDRLVAALRTLRADRDHAETLFYGRPLSEGERYQDILDRDLRDARASEIRSKAERAEKDAAFRVLEQAERRAAEHGINSRDADNWQWFCRFLGMLSETRHFDDYPKTRARVWRMCAEMHSALGDAAAELDCLRSGIQLDPALPVRRRMKALEKQCPPATNAAP